MTMVPKQSNSSSLVDHAISIWKSGVAAVTPRSLMQQKIRRDGRWLIIDDQCEIDFGSVGRLIVVGAGKASAAMAIELIEQVHQLWPNQRPDICGWINAPAGSFSSQPEGIRIHAARPAGLNMPTLEGIQGTKQILNLVSQASKRDVVLCMISGGGSALLVSPKPGLTLEDKQSVSQCVAAAGGNIVQLNLLRRCMSEVKGGGLARACNAGRMISLIISDVLGDPLEIIASGPTILGDLPDPNAGLKVLSDLGLGQHPRLQNLIQWLRQSRVSPSPNAAATVQLENIVLGNLADAVDAAGVKAVELGYRYVMQTARQPEGDVSGVAQDALANLIQLHGQSQIDCWISGGEPTVQLPADHVGKGGRNQQLALSVLELFCSQPNSMFENSELVFLSGGTDGEDGPTDAAGAWIDINSLHRMRELKLDPQDYRQRADAYRFFERIGGLLVTGPTGTNVCDLRIGLSRIKS